MATLASTQVTQNSTGLPIPIDGLHLEVWRVAGGGVGDTATIVPARGRFVVTAVGSQSGTTSISAPQTNVVFTLTASVATTTTFDVWLLVQP